MTDTNPIKRGAKVKKRARDEKAKTVTIVLPDFSSFSVCDAALWHFTHLFSYIPIPSTMSNTATNNINRMDDHLTFGNLSSIQHNMSVLEVSLFPQFNATSGARGSISSTTTGNTFRGAGM